MLCWCKCVLFPLLFVVAIDDSIGVVRRLHRLANLAHLSEPSSRRMGHYLSIYLSISATHPPHRPARPLTHHYVCLECIIPIEYGPTIDGTGKRVYKACRISRRNCTCSLWSRKLSHRWLEVWCLQTNSTIVLRRHRCGSKYDEGRAVQLRTCEKVNYNQKRHGTQFGKTIARVGNVGLCIQIMECENIIIQDLHLFRRTVEHAKD